MRCNAAVLVLGLGLVVAPPVRADEPAGSGAEDDLARLQGRWQQSFTQGGQTYLFTKQIEGNTETLALIKDGEVAYAHQVEFALQVAGPVRLFAFRNLVVTEGPNKGAKSEKEMAYVYRLVGDEFYEIDGFVNDERNLSAARPKIQVWTRGPAAGEQASRRPEP